MATPQPCVEMNKKFAEAETSEGNGSPEIVIHLQPLSEKDSFFAEKQNSLDTRNLKYEYIIPCDVCDKVMNELLDQMIQTARILHLNEIELYFAGDDDFGPFSPRNELESLNYMLGIINSMISSHSHDADRVLHVLQDTITATISSIGDNRNYMISKKITTDAEELLFNWGRSHGMRTKLKIAYFEEAGRGVVATEGLRIGDIALEIPESLIICEDIIHDSDMFDVLKKLDGITSETMLLLWSMRERYNMNSKLKIYFDTLPERFNTGLSFGVDALKVLEGSLLLEELLQAKEHLKTQFDLLFPSLSDSYPAIFKKELYTWDNYLWACELWYSNSMKVAFTDGILRTCLIPVAGFLNHSVCPHILHYGRVDPVTKSLKFCVSKPCEAGEQCFLSYGSFPSSHLLTFYGFLPKGDNPYDIIPLDFDAPDMEDDVNQSSNGESHRSAHMVRGTWLSKGDKSRTYGLPHKLLTYLRAALSTDDTGLSYGIAGKDINKEDETAMLETILSIFAPMLDRLGDCDTGDGDSSSWDVKLALEYKELQQKIISSIITSCNSGLEALIKL